LDERLLSSIASKSLAAMSARSGQRKAIVPTSVDRPPGWKHRAASSRVGLPLWFNRTHRIRLGAWETDRMNLTRLAGVVLIVAGVLGLVYGGFSFTKETHDIKLGPIELSVKEKESVNVPIWAGVAAIAAGALLLIVGGKKG
jgi:hypothetical protein